MNIFNNKEPKKTGTRKTEIHKGTYEDFVKGKAEQLPKIQKEIETLFKDYDGGGVGIVINTYDENGEVDGHKVAILGVDKPAGLIKLAKGLHMASEEAIETLQKSGDPEVLLDAAMEMMRQIVERHEGHKHE